MSDNGSDVEDDSEFTLANVGFDRRFPLDILRDGDVSNELRPVRDAARYLARDAAL